MSEEKQTPTPVDEGGSAEPETENTERHGAPEAAEALPDSEGTAERETDAADAGEGETLEKRLERLEAEASLNYDRFVRATAELDNFKKRTRREMEDLRKYATQALMKELLTVVDNLERAVASSRSGEAANGQLLEGVDMTLKEILKILEKHGVMPIEALEQPFDPTVHEAVLQEAAEGVPDNTVVREFQKGYRFHDRLLRPSMVVVSKT